VGVTTALAEWAPIQTQSDPPVSSTGQVLSRAVAVQFAPRHHGAAHPLRHVWRREPAEQVMPATR
jgi:hypothetical protein